MHEIAPGLVHWTALHPRHQIEVSSYLLVSERVVIDPLLPPEGPAALADTPPAHVLLTNRHHDRDAWRLQDAFGCTVHCVDVGAHELAGRGPVATFAFGDTLPGGVVAHEVDAICPDECALFIPAHRALAVADGVVRWPGVEGLTFVPDVLMDDPETTKRGLRDAYRRLLGLEFDHLLLAHGAPVVGDGRAALAAFVDR